MSQVFFEMLVDPVFWFGFAPVGLLLGGLGWALSSGRARQVVDVVRNTDNVLLKWVFGFGLVLSPIWLLLIVFTLVGVVGIVMTRPDFVASNDASLRWHVLAYVGLLTALGGLVAAPLALVRLFFTSRQTEAQEQGLITDRINKAVEALGAEKEVNRLGRNVVRHHEGRTWSAFEWQDDEVLRELPEPAGEIDTPQASLKWEPIGLTAPNIEVRVGGLLALERLMKDSQEDWHLILQILTAYLRENGGGRQIGLLGDDATLEDWRQWREGALQPLRLDVDTCLRVIERRSAAVRALEAQDGYRLILERAPFAHLDLSGRDLTKAILRNAQLQGANLEGGELQGADLRGAELQGANLRGAESQRANLVRAQLQGADLKGAELQGARLWGAQLQGADLRGAQLQGADLRGAELQGANLERAQFNEHTDLTNATLRGALVRDMDFTNIPQIAEHVGEMFAVGEITPPEGCPAFGKQIDDTYDWDAIRRHWRAWIKAQGWEDVPLPEVEA